MANQLDFLRRVPVRGLTLALVIVLAGIQLFRGNRTNPVSNPAHAINATLNDAPAVAAILERSCNDCHSHGTVWPWYSNIAPVSWVIVHHVNEGREELNLSEWTQYSLQRKQKLLDKICKETKRGEMPGLQYTLLHPESKLTQTDINILCNWTEAAKQRSSAKVGTTASGSNGS